MKINQITPAPWNTRTAITEESVRALAASMEADGLIQPISICDNTDGDGYICYDGNRRLAAAKLLGWDEIAANYTDITPDEAKVRTVTANLQRDDDDPLLAAGVIAALLDEGMDAGQIAAKMGKTTAWVNRRRKMIGAADALKEVANKVTVEALERVAVLPEKVQASVCKLIETRAKYMGRVGLGDIRYDIEREMRDLDGAKFDTTPCASCPRRTGAEADLFGVAADGLGKCLDCKCFEKMRNAWEDAEIAKLVGDAECVRLKYAWGVPEGAAHARPKRDKKHPCAYVYTDSAGNIVVKWGESAKAAKAREDAERKEREAADAERQEKRNRINAITEALANTMTEDFVTERLTVILKRAKLDAAVEDYIVSAVCDAITSWHSPSDWADIVRTFAFAAGVLTPAGRKELLAEYPADGEDED